MTRIIFVCYANVCRSTMAEFIFRNMIRRHGMEDQIEVESAAISDVAVGKDIHEGTKKKLSEYAIPYVSRQARKLRPDDYEGHDYLIGMDQKNLTTMKEMYGGDPDHKIYRLLDFTNENRDVSDPWYTGDFDSTYDDVIQGCIALWKRITETIQE